MKPQGIPAPPGGAPPFAPEPVGIPYTPGAPIVVEAPKTASSPTTAVQHLSYWQEVPRQTLALLTKNFILARRNRFSTFLRLFASLFFILLIFLVNEGIKSRTASLSSYKDLTDPERVVVGGIPACKVARGREKCYTFGYIPAPYPEYRPDVTYPNLAAWRSAVDSTNKAVDGWCDKTAGGTRCEEADCKRGTEVPACSDCCAQWRTHQVVRAIMKNNGTAAIPPEKIMGWPNETVADKFILDNPQDIQGTYIFNSPDYKTMTFLVQQNSSRADAVREVWTRPFLEATVPMQVAAMKEIARVVFLNESNLPFEIAMQEYPHPAVNVATFEGVVAPLYLLGCAMFPFVIQMTEVVYEREFKLRQALAAMGLYDLSYWFSWHIYQSALAFFSSFFLYAFGCLFQFSLFLKNDFGVIFITFWMFGQAMVGFGFLIGAFLSRSAQAVTVGFGFFMIGFILYFVIVAGIPFGTLKGGTAPLSYVTNATTGNLTAVTTGEQVVEPLFAAVPPTLLVKVVADLGVLTATDKDVGLRFNEAYSYCTLDVNCNPSYSIGMCWVTWIIEYILYSLLALYFENVLPDAMGVRKAPWYFLTPSYWGYGEPRIVDKVEVIEASTDEDVIAEEQIMTQRANQPFDPVQAIEIRGLRQTFTRGGKAFHAVKDPWYAVGRKQLFALLGPNGAGKTTTINMLTGFLPPTTGNALVLGHTVAHPSGMNRIKRFMGVCPQFDILWDNLTAKEHLMLFGTIKGIASDAVAAEADRRIEQVRLSESANQVSGAFSGGMKRRLSVAVALIGDPQVVYLDEPTTGMDPINRRHVWDVIEAAKQDRTIVLTTHSMEEADILGDRIAIMAKGRLRCLGNAVRLKNRFGAGYRVSVSCGDNMKLDGPQCMGVKQMFLDSLGSQAEEETKAYMHFNVAASEDDKLAGFFAQLDSRATELGIVDVQVGMSSLEDVFLTIAKKAEVDEAKVTNKTTLVTLKTGEEVGVLLGQEEALTSPLGTQFQVVWGTDEEGRLIPVSTTEKKMEDKTIAVTCPEGVSPGQAVQIETDGQKFQVTVPEGVTPGQTFNAAVKVAAKTGATVLSTETATFKKLTVDEVNQRVKNLQTSFAAQSNALFRKNLTFQGKRRCTNCCLLLVPIFLTVLVLLLQLLIEVLFLGRNFVRCPYCGPADDFAKTYCANKDCADFFFYDNTTATGRQQRADIENLFEKDVHTECRDLMKTCGGNGNTECFLPQYATGFQFGFCPFTIGPKNPDLRQAPAPTFRSSTPVLFTGRDETISKKVVEKLYPKTDDSITEHKRMAEEAAKSMNFMMWNVLMTPKLGCTDMTAANGNMTYTMSDQTHREAMCKLIQQGQGTNNPCCVDLSDTTTPSVLTGFQPGVNMWTPTPAAHTTATFNAAVAAKVLAGTAATAAGVEVLNAFYAQGMRYVPPNPAGGSFGFGKVLSAMHLAAANNSISNAAKDYIAKANHIFTCVEPKYTRAAELALGSPTGDTCINLEEGMAKLAHAMSFPQEVMPVVATDDNSIEKITIDGKDWYPDTPGRWAQACEFYTQNYTRVVLSNSDKDRLTLQESEAYIARLQIPCGCQFLVHAKQALAFSYPTGAAASFLMGLPDLYSCVGAAQDASGNTVCTPGASRTHPFAIPTFKMGTPRWGSTSAFQEPSLNANNREWWNWDFVLTKVEQNEFKKKYQDELADSCERDRTCWRDIGRGAGYLTTVSGDCSRIRHSNCYFQKMANLSGTKFECIEANSTWQADLKTMNKKIYDGTWDKFSPNPTEIEEVMQGYDLSDSSDTKVNVTLLFNDTTEVSGGQGPRPMIRIAGGLSDIVDAYVNYRKGTDMQYFGGLRGYKEMPQPAGRLDLDLGGIIGGFFFTLSFSLLFPTIVVSILYEKEQRLRVMMRMMGLGSTAYWAINYLFWFLIFTLYILFIVLIASNARLPSGYTIGLFTKTDAGVHVVNFFLWENFCIALAFLWATVVRSSRAGSISSTLFIILMTLVAFTAWDSGGFFLSDNTTEGAKTLITMFPFWGFYRAWIEYGEYAYSASRSGGKGLTFENIANDEKCGMDTVLIVHALEWPLFLLAALYLDNVLDTGHGVPKHPLFFLGWKYTEDVTADVEAGGGDSVPDDVRKEAERAEALAKGSRENQDAVMILGLNKVYPPYMGNPAKVAVKTISMSVQHGECFGMLGPNGAGKTTCINMLVGFATPTHGNAIVEGFSIRTEMARIYSLMGVCPQHDVLWETLTAREHMLFYGRLKNLKGKELALAVTEGLRQVNLLNVMNERAGTFSGGMKRRLSVAISMIGAPLTCYLDEPSTGLDPASRRTLWGCIKEAKKSRAIFLTTHSMEEAEGLCDRLGIFVDGALRCIGNPKELTARFGGYYVLTVTSTAGAEAAVSQFVNSMAPGVRTTYALAGTQKFEIPSANITLAKAFGDMTANKQRLQIIDWGISNTTLEDAFIKISRGAVGT